MSETLKQIISELNKYKMESGCKGVVFGLSGGKDSTVVAMIAKMVWGDNVMALVMPNGDQKDLSEAIEIAEQIGISYKIINIEETFEAIEEALQGAYYLNSFGEKRYEEPYEFSDMAVRNIPPRIRMLFNYGVAQTLGYRVIGTGNKSEAYIGWTTKYGDSAYDINPIGDLCCTDVVKLGLELADLFDLDQRYILKKPEDGLCGTSDEENFGFSYSQLDSYIKTGSIGNYQITIDDCIEHVDGKAKIEAKIAQMHEASAHKRQMAPIIKIN